MPTYAFSRTREQMADMIARKLGIKATGQELEAEEAQIVYAAMNLRLKELHHLGLLWWQIGGAETSVAITGGTVTATISATDYLLPVSLMLTVGTQQSPVEIISHRQYQAITDKGTTGTPECAFISGAVIRMYPVPLVSGSLKLTYEAIAADVENGVAPDVPVEMMRAFSCLVAADLVDEYDDINPGKGARLLAGVEPAMRTIRALNAERVDTTTIQAEYF